MIHIVNAKLEFDLDLVPIDEIDFFEYVMQQISIKGDLYFFDYKIIRHAGNVYFYLVTDISLFIFFYRPKPFKKFFTHEIDLMLLKLIAAEFPHFNLCDIESLNRLIYKETSCEVIF